MNTAVITYINIKHTIYPNKNRTVGTFHDTFMSAFLSNIRSWTRVTTEPPIPIIPKNSL